MLVLQVFVACGFAFAMEEKAGNMGVCSLQPGGGDYVHDHCCRHTIVRFAAIGARAGWSGSSGGGTSEWAENGGPGMG